MDCKEKINSLPASPGVYIMKDETGGILYVGKANNLRRRVSSYFYPRRSLSGRIAALVDKVKDIAHIPTATEEDALIYENSLIKELLPKYNVALRDDKTYPFLKLTVNERFPRLSMTRQKKEDGALYYGPYTSAKLLKKALAILRQLFPLRTCGKIRKKLCLNYHIAQCPGPCAGKVDEADYRQIVSELRLFLEGKRQELLKRLTERMTETSKKEDFEEAARLKDRIEALGAVRSGMSASGAVKELEELQNILGLNNRPDCIEAFDVSNIMGKEAVGSMICFYKGKPKKDGYRRFRINSASGVDDYAMMREILRRRYSRLAEARKGFPDLVLIDGGKGHLTAALDELARLGLSAIPVAAIAKEFERIYAKDQEPIVLPKESKALHMLERIRDEAHRFAISYHKILRSRGVSFSELDGIPGIGRKRKLELLRCFGAIGGIKAASIEELLKVKGMNEKSARQIIEHFKGR